MVGGGSSQVTKACCSLLDFGVYRRKADEFAAKIISDRPIDEKQVSSRQVKRAPQYAVALGAKRRSAACRASPMATPRCHVQHSPPSERRVATRFLKRGTVGHAGW